MYLLPRFTDCYYFLMVLKSYIFYLGSWELYFVSVNFFGSFPLGDFISIIIEIKRPCNKIVSLLWSVSTSRYLLFVSHSFRAWVLLDYSRKGRRGEIRGYSLYKVSTFLLPPLFDEYLLVWRINHVHQGRVNSIFFSSHQVKKGQSF